MFFTTVLATTGCSSEGDAFRLNVSEGADCGPAPVAGASILTFGAVGRSEASEDIRVTGVALADADGAELVGAAVWAGDHRTPGVVTGWPPVLDGKPYPGWEATQEPGDAVVAPGERLTVSFGVRRTGESYGVVRALRITYEVGGRTAQQEARYQWFLAPTSCLDLEPFQFVDKDD
ncbi:hypothetical protein [Phycicoccus flavus]|uniref:hypothetical protein n=1 Tax=Phycicoccus flavus TaxID=2502783 RepID=UPI000FEC1D79|nr:hypothetical protein [Phycicoccus flavus]NHA68029.1 hypothetical protein [Phycicoccus flavus]